MIEFDALGCLEVGLCVIGSGLFRFWFIMRWLCGSLIYHSGLSEFLHHVFFLVFFVEDVGRFYVDWSVRVFDVSYVNFVICFWLMIFFFFLWFLTFFIWSFKVWYFMLNWTGWNILIASCRLLPNRRMHWSVLKVSDALLTVDALSNA